MKYLILLLVLLLIPLVVADINVTIDERGKITSFYDQYYVYRLNGTISVHNPSNFSLFNIELPYYLSTLSVRSNYSNPDNYITDNKIFITTLGPNEEYVFDYQLVGITTEDLSTNEQSVLYNGILALEPKIYSNLFGSLRKAEIEDSSITGRDGRLISVELRNPTSFTYTIDKVVVIKTLEMDPNDAVGTWSFAQEKSVLNPGEGWSFDFIDEDASEGEIYWLTTDIYIDQILVSSTQNITRYDQDDLFEILSNETLNETVNESVGMLLDRVYIRKFVSSGLVNPGDVINITLLVNNLQPQDVEFSVKDVFPEGFEFISSQSGSVSDHEVNWQDKLSGGLAKRYYYQIKFMDEDLVGVDYFAPAELSYNGVTYYSQSVPYVRKYVPEHKVFVQKNVKFLSGEEVQVTLAVKNLGESSLENVVVKEHLLSTAEFREISQAPVQRGLWRIDNLKTSQTWETSYVTDRASVLNTMPEIFGVPQGSVLQTIILSNLISSNFSVVPTNIIEFVGIALLIIIVALYFVPPSYFSRTRSHQKKELTLMSRELDTLKRKTDVTGQDIPLTHQTLKAPGSTPSQPPHAKDPNRLARHRAVEDAQALLDKSIEDITGEKKTPDQSSPQEKTVDSSAEKKP